jgi:hypothetical protein
MKNIVNMWDNILRRFGLMRVNETAKSFEQLEMLNSKSYAYICSLPNTLIVQLINEYLHYNTTGEIGFEIEYALKVLDVDLVKGSRTISSELNELIFYSLYFFFLENRNNL